jgi:guanylate kinase
MKPFVYIITGPAGAGKTTVANELAKLIDKSARVDVDYLRHSIKEGYVKPYPTTVESKKQIELSIKNACQISKNFVDKGFNVFIDDIVINNFKLYKKYLKEINLFVFLLLPNKNTVAKRDTGRKKEQVMGERALQLHDKFSKIESDKWHIIDSSTHTVKQTVDEIFEVIKTL